MNSASSPAAFSWRAVMLAGIFASFVFQILEIVLMPLFGGAGAWSSARMIAAMVLGRGVLPPPDTFDLFIVATAAVVDVALAIAYTTVLALIVRGWSRGAALIGGAVFGIGLYVVNFHGFTALFPWFEMGRNGVTLFTHVVFSLTAALAFKLLQPGGAPGAPGPLVTT